MKIEEAEKLVDEFLDGRVKVFKKLIADGSKYPIKTGCLRAVIVAILSNDKIKPEDILHSLIAMDKWSVR